MRRGGRRDQNDRGGSFRDPAEPQLTKNGRFRAEHSRCLAPLPDLLGRLPARTASPARSLMGDVLTACRAGQLRTLGPKALQNVPYERPSLSGRRPDCSVSPTSPSALRWRALFVGGLGRWLALPAISYQLSALTSRLLGSQRWDESDSGSVRSIISDPRRGPDQAALDIVDDLASAIHGPD